MTLTCIAVEDEPLALERLQDYIRKLPLLDLRGSYQAANDALVHLKREPVDVVFLDISLGGGFSGIELLETSAVSSQVIFTTAHPEHALKAYDLKVADYLLKPFTYARFVQAVDRVHERLGEKTVAVEPRSIFVKTEHRLERVPLSQVLYIEGMRDYRQIRTVHKRIMTLETFGDLGQRIPPELICRVHKSFMVALDRIESVEKDQIKIADAQIPISATYREAFYALISAPGRGQARS